MIIRKIKLINYRSYKSTYFEPNEKLSIICGDNAQGKTNIIESIIFLATGKSHRTSKDSELVLWGAQTGAYASIEIQSDNKAQENKIEIYIPERKKKQIKVNGKPISKMSQLVGVLNVVVFSPEDLKIIKEGPSVRRKTIDLALCQVDKQYFNAITNYTKALEQKNVLIKKIIFTQKTKNDESIKQISSWDEQLAIFGEYIQNARNTYINDLKKHAKKIHSEISGGIENLEINYAPSINPQSIVDKIEKQTEKIITKEIYLKALYSNMDLDFKKGFTSLGVHRDDIDIYINKINVKIFGSQGQQRTAALSIKLSELDLMKQYSGQSPILLLDDVMSELDEKRQKYLINVVKSHQTIITGTHFMFSKEFKQNNNDFFDEFIVENSIIKRI